MLACPATPDTSAIVQDVDDPVIIEPMEIETQPFTSGVQSEPNISVFESDHGEIDEKSDIWSEISDDSFIMEGITQVGRRSGTRSAD